MEKSDQKLSPLQTVNVNLTNAIETAFQHLDRLATINDKLGGSAPEEPACKVEESFVPNGTVEEMKQKLTTLNSILGRVSTEITRLQNTVN